jgi:hypothetical protein
MRKAVNEQRLEELEAEFGPLLIACLTECVERRRWGLFEQNESPKGGGYIRWDAAIRLKELATEINQIRAAWGDVNPDAERFLHQIGLRGENLPGEPKRAAKLLNELALGRRRD